MATLKSHVATLWPAVRHSVRPYPAPAGKAWSTSLEDPDLGPLRLTGLWSQRDGASCAVLVLHGLGGSPSAYYCGRAAHWAHARGFASLRLALRGADRLGEDWYHAALTADLHAALASQELASFSRIYVLGYSMGGHVALRAAMEDLDPRVRAVAAVCSPLDLSACRRELDGPRGVLYRRYLLRGLSGIYAQVAARREVHLPVRTVRSLRTFLEFDGRVIAPRHHFLGADDYYARASAGPRLGGLRRPVLLVASDSDPLVSVASLRPSLGDLPSSLTLRWVRGGGHVNLPATADLGFAAPRGLESQIFAWFDGQM